MSLLLKGVFDMTCSIFNAVVHVLLRDLTNYYWYLEDAQRECDIAVEGLISNLTNENIQSPGPILRNEGAEFLNADELIDGNEPCGSFCTEIKIEESSPNVLDDTTEDNLMVQNYEVLIGKDILNNEENTNTLQESEQQPNNMQITLNEIQRDQDDISKHEDEILNFLSSRKKQNCVWVEIDNMRRKMEDRNLNPDYLNIPEKEPIENTIKNLEVEDETLVNAETENVVSGAQEEESSNALQSDNDLSECSGNERAVENVHESPETLSPVIMETLSPETGEIVHSETGETPLTGSSKTLFTEEEMQFEKTLQSRVNSSEDISIGDSKKSAAETQSDAKSDVSSELELGIRNFGSLRGEHSNVGKPEKKTEGKKKPVKSKISRYIGSTTIPKPKKVKPGSPQKPITGSKFVEEEKSKFVKEEKLKFVEEKLKLVKEKSKPVEVQLQPVTYDEITNTQPLLNNDKQNETVPKFTEIQDELSEMSKVPAESDVGSACSDDSWDSWLGKFVTIMRSKSPVRDVPLTPKSDTEKKEDLCDCVNTHRCLRVVDSEEEVSQDLLTAEQLRSVETGSVSDWLYRVNPPNPLLPCRMKPNETVKCAIVEQQKKTKLYSDSSDEDIAKKFFIEQWLDETETYYTGLSSKFIGSGDIIG